MFNDWQTVAGLVGITLVISGSNVLPHFREWCQGFIAGPLRWLGFALEFAGIVTDKSMATGFLIGVIWWSGTHPWKDVLLFGGLITIASALADSVLAMLYAMLRKTAGGGAPSGPIPIPRRRQQEDVGGEAPRPSPLKRGVSRVPTGPMTEEDAWRTLDDEDEAVDRTRTVTKGEGA